MGERRPNGQLFEAKPRDFVTPVFHASGQEPGIEVYIWPEEDLVELKGLYQEVEAPYMAQSALYKQIRESQDAFKVSFREYQEYFEVPD